MPHHFLWALINVIRLDSSFGRIFDVKPNSPSLNKYLNIIPLDGLHEDLPSRELIITVNFLIDTVMLW